MLRTLFIYLSGAGWAQRLVRNWKFAQKMAARFVAGETLDEAVEVIRQLNDQGFNVTLDHLGENVTNREGALAAREEVLQIMERIDREKLRSGVSVKLSQIGLVLDEEFCLDNLHEILTNAQALGLYVRIDMEDSSLTEKTLRCYYRCLEAGFGETVGIVIQTYLYRSEEDIQRILSESGTVRLCKGAYKEPASVAFPRKKDVDDNFDQLARNLLDKAAETDREISRDGIHPPIPALATHDEERIRLASAYAERIHLPKHKMEFQMLFGIRFDLQKRLVAEGYPVRIYVPYGEEWYPYFTRRLAERPANLWFFISNYLKG
ncbi:MAG: proline dehydrogenase family protein [Anaerolineales bacterium]|nr:proline dehydrogenase family protein [Anaerolineales bacterium]